MDFKPHRSDFICAVLLGITIGAILWTATSGALSPKTQSSELYVAPVHTSTALHPQYSNYGVEYIQGGEDNTAQVLQPAVR